jgi:hypothetical protein
MPKTFYTEHEIEDLFKTGVTSLDLNENVVLTGLAYEKATRLGIKLIQPGEQVADAPVRPYLSREHQQPAASSYTHLHAASPCNNPGCPEKQASAGLPADLSARIKNAVVARLGSNVDQSLLDAIIRRVLDQVKV